MLPRLSHDSVPRGSGFPRDSADSWSRLSDSNRRPAVYKTAALPTELKRRAAGQAAAGAWDSLTQTAPGRETGGDGTASVAARAHECREEPVRGHAAPGAGPSAGSALLSRLRAGLRRRRGAGDELGQGGRSLELVQVDLLALEEDGGGALQLPGLEGLVAELDPLAVLVGVDGGLELGGDLLGDVHLGGGGHQALHRHVALVLGLNGLGEDLEGRVVEAQGLGRGLIEHHAHRVHDDAGPLLLEELAGVEGQGDLLVAQELVDLLGVEALELGAVRAGVVEVDVEDGRRGGDGVESGALAVGPGGVGENLLGDAALVRLRGGQALARCGELRALGVLLGVDAEVDQVAEPSDHARARSPDEAAAGNGVAARATGLGLAQLLGLETRGLTALGLGLAGLVTGHAVLLVMR